MGNRNRENVITKQSKRLPRHNIVIHNRIIPALKLAQRRPDHVVENVRLHRFPYWVLPTAGGLLFGTLIAVWYTSALWFFRTIGVDL